MKVILFFLLVSLLLFGCTEELQLNPTTKTEPLVVTPSEDVLVTAEPEAKAALAALIERGSEVSFTVTYDITTMFPEVGEEQVTLTVYQQDEKHLRTDSSGVFQGTPWEVREYFVEDEFISCGDDDGWICYVIGSVEDVPEEELPAPEDFFANATVTVMAGQTIAGESTSCFLIEFPLEGFEDSLSQETCYATEGILLYMKSALPEGSMEQRATAFSLGVAADAFDFPAEPQEVPAPKLANE